MRQGLSYIGYKTTRKCPPGIARGITLSAQAEDAWHRLKQEYRMRQLGFSWESANGTH